MRDEFPELRTPAGRERMLSEHETRLDGNDKEHAILDRRILDVERKLAARDRRWDILTKAVTAIALAAVGSLITALITLGIHP